MSPLFRWFLIWVWFCPVPRGLCGEGLDFEIYEWPSRAFTREEALTFPENGRADAAAVLRGRGFEMPEGGAAFFDAGAERLFLRSTGRDLRRMARLSEGIAVTGGDEDEWREVTLLAVCYAVPLAAVPAGFGPFSAVAELPAEKLTVLERVSLTCRGGQRALSEKQEEAAPGVAAEDEAEPLRRMEMECTLSGELIDLNFYWGMRGPGPETEGRFSVTAQYILRSGQSVFQELGVTAEAEPRLVLLRLEPRLRMPPPAEEGKDAKDEGEPKEAPAAGQPEPAPAK